jgi:CubicO group peptidase (beta-lactamase class C family)
VTMQRLEASSVFCAIVTVGLCFPLASKQVGDFAARTLKPVQVPRIAVAIIENGKVIQIKGSGFRSLKARQPVCLDTDGLG